jgi:hypothetical protein
MNIKVQTNSHKQGTGMEWNFGVCSNSKTKEYEREKLYAESCCLMPGEYILKCANNYQYGWEEGHLEIEGHKFCDDVHTYKSTQMIKISGTPVLSFKIFVKTILTITIILILRCSL